MPILSLLVPTYNRLGLFKNCLESLRQTTVDAEIVVLDNGSTDGTAEYLNQLEDPRIRVIRHATNQKDPYNKLFSLATGKYMAWMGDDDWALPGGYEALVELLESHPDVDLAYSLAQKVNGKGEDQGVLRWPGLLDHAYIGGRDEFADLIVACYLSPQTAVYRRSLYLELGGFDTDPEFIAAADWDMMLRYVAGRKTAFIPFPTVAIRFHEQSYSESVAKREGTFARGRIALWRKWLVEHPDPVILGDFGWRRLADAFLPDLRYEFGQDQPRIDDYMRQLAAVKEEVRQRQNQKVLGGGEGDDAGLKPTAAGNRSSGTGAGSSEPEPERFPGDSRSEGAQTRSPLRILFASEYYFPMIGGAEQAANELLQAFAARGHSVRALCPGENLPATHGGVQLYTLQSPDDVRRQINDFVPDLILTQGHLAPLVVGLGKARGIPVWFYVHALDHVCPKPDEMVRCDRDCNRCGFYLQAIEDMEAQKEAIRMADRVLTPSRFAATELETFTGRKGIEVLPPPTRLLWIEDPESRPYITFSTAAPYKGLSTFLEIARAFPKERFLIVGRKDPADWGIKLEEYPNVTRWGVVTTEAFLRVTRILLVPSVLAETFGRVVPEAQAAGSTVLASRYGGLVESVGTAGVLVAPHTDSRAWIRALRDVLARPKLRADLREKGLAQARKVDASRVASAFVLETEEQLGPPASLKPRVAWEGSQFVYHSLAHVNRQLCLGLLQSGEVDLTLIPYEQDQFNGAADPDFSPLAGCVNRRTPAQVAVHVRHQWPPNFNPPPQGAWVIVQPWEYGGIPQEWIRPMCDLVDEIWVYSSWVRSCYLASGIPADKVRVIPLGVDTQRFQPEGVKFPLKTRRKFRFLFLGGTIHRKGIDLLLRAYLKAFRSSDDVCLVIKGQSGHTYSGSELHKVLEGLIHQDPGAPEIEYFTPAMDENGLASLYRACDAFVMPYRGEGFGLPMAEALACGLPVIATGKGAAMDFLDDDRAYFIPSQRKAIESVPVGPFEPSGPGFWLEEPDEDTLVKLLRQVYSNPEEAAAKGRQGRLYALENLSWEEPVRLVLERIRSLAEKTPLRFQSRPKSEPREAFLFRPDWTHASWMRVVMAFVFAFKYQEPVALVVFLEGSEVTLELAQESILSLLSEAGRETFPDIVLLDKPDEIISTLSSYDVLHWVSDKVQDDSMTASAISKQFNQALAKFN